MKKNLLTITFLISSLLSNAQHVELTDDNPFYAQNFDFLPTGAVGHVSDEWIDGETIQGWYAKTMATTPTEPSIYYHFNLADTWLADSTCITKGQGISNIGINFDTDRSLGSWINNKTGDVYFGIKIRNNTSSTIEALSVSYTGEQWLSAGPDIEDLIFSYKTNAEDIAEEEGWTEVEGLKFSTLSNPESPRKNATISGKEPENRKENISTTFSVNVPVGEYIWLRWFDLNNIGKAGNAILAIDDVEIEITKLTNIKSSKQIDDIDFNYDPQNSIINIKSHSGIKQIAIYSIDGKTVFSQIYNSNKEDNISLPGLSGYYIVRINTLNESISKKIYVSNLTIN